MALHEHLEEQVGFVQRSARAFDAGDTLEAKRLAAPIRTLVHQTGSSHALLAQLGVLDTMLFLDTAGEIDPSNMLSSPRLTVTRFGPGGDIKYVPRLESLGPSEVPGRWVSFEPWWRRPVIKDDDGAEFSRRDLVLAVAHKDGGVHVDRLPHAYERLSRSNSLGWSLSHEGTVRPMNNPVLPSIRQIAFEVEQSIYRQFPELPKAA